MKGKARSPQFIETPSGRPEDIYLLTIASGTLKRLTTDPAGDTSPDFSPDGSRIVFESDRGEGRDEDIYLMNVDGTNQMPITSDGSIEKNPRWSPDGARIAFSASPTVGTGRREGLYTVQPDGSDPFQVTSGTAFEQVYSPDGQRLVAGIPLFTIGTDRSKPFPLINEKDEQIAAFVGDWR